MPRSLGGVTPPTMDQARAVLEAQPFSKLVGATLSQFGDGRATIDIPLRLEHLQQGGIAHGGLVAYGADNAMTFAGGWALGPDVLTGSISVEYVAPAKGDVIRAEAWVSYVGARRAVCHCTVLVQREGDWHVCAIGQGLIKARS